MEFDLVHENEDFFSPIDEKKGVGEGTKDDSLFSSDNDGDDDLKIMNIRRIHYTGNKLVHQMHFEWRHWYIIVFVKIKIKLKQIILLSGSCQNKDEVIVWSFIPCHTTNESTLFVDVSLLLLCFLLLIS